MKTTKTEIFDEHGKSRGFHDPANVLNDLTGKEWIFSTKTVIPKHYPSSFRQDLRNQHGGQKPPELCAELIKTFTKENEVVLDPFAGVGGTLIACSLTNRQGFGVELNGKWIKIYQEVCSLEKIKPQPLFLADSCTFLKEYNFPTIDFILTDVPYWNMDAVEKSKGVYKKHGEAAKDVYSKKSKLNRFNEESPTKDEWRNTMLSVFNTCYLRLKPGGYCAVFIGNMYTNGEYHLLNAELSEILKTIGYVLKGEIIWYDVAKKLHLYGINYSWIPSVVHQFVMIFRKEKER